MPNENEQNMLEQQETPTEKNYGEALAELKKNSVPKDMYDKLAKENKDLMEAIINGQTAEAPAESRSVDIEGLRKEMFNKELTNLDYVKDALALREALLAKGEPDPFLPIGKQISADADDIAAAERVAECLSYCVEISNDDPTAFTAALQSKLQDPRELTMLAQARKGKRGK